MPSDRPKVTAYLSPEAADALAAAARALGQSRSRLVADLLDSAIPVLSVITQAALVVSSAPDRQREALAGLAEGLEPLGAEAETLISDMRTAIAAAQGRLPEPPSTPAPSNTGVSFP